MAQGEDGLRFAKERIQVDATSRLGENYQKLDNQIKEDKTGPVATQAWLGEIDGGNADQAWNEAGSFCRARCRRTSGRLTSPTSGRNGGISSRAR